MSLLGWLDLSEEHRKKVLQVMAMFKEQGVIDELGFGTIRDTISDMLFPGTSVAQTRAKYFLLIPYLIKEIESKQRFYGRDFIQELERQEKQLIPYFKPFRRGDGVIGKRNGNPIQKPSSIYWNGLRTYKILRFSGTLSNYSHYIEHQQKKSQKQKVQQLADSGTVKGDDRDVSFLSDSHLWSQLPSPETDWRTTLSMDLSYAEADFLREKIITSCPDSLFAYTLNHLAEEAVDFDSIYDYLAETSLPSHYRQVIAVAVDFNFIMAGALVRYNYLIQQLRHNGEMQQKAEVWRKYWNNIQEFDWEGWDTSVLWKLCPKTSYSTRQFVEQWITLVKQSKYDAATGDKLIKDREFRLKGPKRSRLHDVALAQKQEGWTGVDVDSQNNVFYLSYRWQIVQKLIQDIVKGLKKHATAE